MTIETVSEPSDLAQWRSGAEPFYLELFGETRPFVDTAYAELIPASSAAEATPVSGASAPVYEYWWTIGHPGLPQEGGRFPHWLHRPNESEDPEGAATEEFWSDLDDPAARVYMYFPRNGGWRIKEVVATVKYLSPAPQQKDFWEKAVQDWTVLQPLVQDASTLAGAMGPQVGVPVKGAVTTLNALAQLKLNSIPPDGGYEWSVGKVTFGHDDEKHQDRSGVMQGVVWKLPAKMFTDLGGRLTGSLAVSYIPCKLQGDSAATTTEELQLKPRAILAHAVVYRKGQEQWMPPDRRSFLRLQVAPQQPATPEPASSPKTGTPDKAQPQT